MEIQTFEKYTAVSREHEPYLRELTSLADQGPYRPRYHIHPPCGLLNDPNGLCYFGGAYHVFYQWHPFGPSHGMKHWAHVKSTDMKSWEWGGNMLIPDREYEKNGCYSGNAFVNETDGLCYLYYTANYKTEEGRIPRQALAVMDETGHIEKYGNAPIIDGTPEGLSGDIRDPFVFQRDGQYHMLLGASDTEGRGQLILYSGKTLTSWEYRGIIRVPLPDRGTMVECPGIIEVDKKDVLLLSVIGLKPDKDRYRNQFSSIYLTGRLDLSKMEFVAEYSDEIDCGFDFYAPQVFYGRDKKPLLLGWFGCGDQKLYEDEHMWRHGLTMPRELSLRDGRLCAKAADAVTECYCERIELGKGCDKYETVPGTYRLHMCVEQEEGVRTVWIGREQDFWSLTVDMMAGRLTWDRSTLQKPVDPAYGMTRSASILPCARAELEIFMDNSFVEIYVNGGERVFSGRVYQ